MLVKTCEVYCWTSSAHLPVRDSNSSGWGLEPRFTFAPASSSLRQVLVRPGRIELPIEPYQGPVMPFNYERKVDEQVSGQRYGLATTARPIGAFMLVDLLGVEPRSFESKSKITLSCRLIGADDWIRTSTARGHYILSVASLPISSHPHVKGH